MEYIDLKKVTRSESGFLCKIYLKDRFDDSVLWLECGEVDLLEHNDGSQSLRARYKQGVTDFEHDPCIALWLPLVGLKFETLCRGMVKFSAYIKTPRCEMDFEEFAIAPPEIPSDVDICNYCEEPHMLLPYQPARDPELFKAMGGRKVEIVFKGASK